MPPNGSLGKDDFSDYFYSFKPEGFDGPTNRLKAVGAFLTMQPPLEQREAREQKKDAPASMPFPLPEYRAKSEAVFPKQVPGEGKSLNYVRSQTSERVFSVLAFAVIFGIVSFESVKQHRESADASKNDVPATQNDDSLPIEPDDSGRLSRLELSPLEEQSW